MAVRSVHHDAAEPQFRESEGPWSHPLATGRSRAKYDPDRVCAQDLATTAASTRKRGISMKEGPVLIHVWEVDPAEEAAAVGRLEEMFAELVDDPGFVAARVLENAEQTSLAAVVEMRSVEDRRRIEELPKVRETLHHLHGTANIIIRLYHEVGEYPT